MSIAVFVSPKAELLNKIEYWKRKVNNDFPGQAYTNHPPHLTILNVDVENYQLAIKLLEEKIKDFDPFYLSSNEKDVFWDDELTGGHTIYFKVKNNDAMLNIQKKLAESILSIIINKPLGKVVFTKKEFVKSYKKYGSPFIGKHWIPHFSISSLKVNQKNSLIKHFLNEAHDYRLYVNYLSIWKVSGNYHKMIKKIELT